MSGEPVEVTKQYELEHLLAPSGGQEDKESHGDEEEQRGEEDNDKIAPSQFQWQEQAKKRRQWIIILATFLFLGLSVVIAITLFATGVDIGTSDPLRQPEPMNKPEPIENPESTLGPGYTEHPGPTLIPDPTQELDPIQEPTRKRPALVVASWKSQDVKWLAQVPERWQIYRYCSDCLPHEKPYADKYGTTLPVPSKIGREAMPYLTFLIDHYHDPPPYTLFIHGHFKSWHQPEALTDILRALNFTAVDEEGWIPLRCTRGSCNPKSQGWDLTKGPQGFKDSGFWGGAEKMAPAFFKVMYQSEEDDESQRKPTPSSHHGIGGGQFAISAATMTQAPLALYKRLRAPLLSKRAMQRFDHLLRNVSIETWGIPKTKHNTFETLFDGEKSPVMDSYAFGALMEGFWADTFGMGTNFCPTVKRCRGVFLSGAVDCKGGDAWAGKLPTCVSNETAIAQIEEENRKFLGETEV